VPEDRRHSAALPPPIGAFRNEDTCSGPDVVEGWGKKNKQDFWQIRSAAIGLMAEVRTNVQRKSPKNANAIARDQASGKIQVPYITLGRLDRARSPEQNR
jgi:hypothetical protein